MIPRCEKDCPRRKVGCHNVNTCETWAAQVEAQQVKRAAKAEERQVKRAAKAEERQKCSDIMRSGGRLGAYNSRKRRKQENEF